MKKMKCALMLAVVILCTTGAALLLTPSASAAGSTCWQVECNTCCRSGGKVLCTQRACV